ncbi:MAG TPA: phosphatidate cytidylyltransferase [Chitinophagaceae bacterium]|nr:phosphatidate cytidylyltransferase [Chitinophagaceae bacterium]HRF18107.1 phosphatidate cytidylyltransferase [Chitinophagaceae bacterium]
MAFNWSVFKTRALTAIVFVAVMLAGLLWNKWSFFILFSIIHFGCWWEYLKLTEKIYSTSFQINAKLGFMLAGYGLMLWFCKDNYQIAGYSLSENFSMPVSGAGFLLLIIGIFLTNPVHIHAFGMGLLGLLYISLSWGLMMDLTGFIDSFFYGSDIVFSAGSLKIFFVIIPIVIIATIWINDTMAYIVGSLIGKTPLSKISPKKTWEGTIGGIILAIAVVGLLAKFFIPLQYHLPGFVLEIANYHWFIIAAIAAIAGTFGDLLESKLKRMAGVKDSGQIMPGHGGFMDRFDSLLLATPAVWLYVKLMML